MIQTKVPVGIKHNSAQLPMFKQFYVPFKYNSSACVWYLIFINLLLLLIETLYVDFLQNIFIVLAFNFSFSIALILRFFSYQDTLYHSLSSGHKLSRYKQFSEEFFKLSGNFCLLALISSISSKFIPNALLQYCILFQFLISLIIMLRWNSKDFLNETKLNLYFLLNFSISKSVEFTEILIADVWTSFAKPSSQLISPNYRYTRTILFW